MIGFEFRTRSADGAYRWLRCSAIGAVEERLIYASATDVTDLHEAEARFAGAFSNASLPTLLASVDAARMGRIEAVNPAACAFVGYSESELLSRNFQSLMHPDDLESILLQLGRLLDGEIDSFELEKRYLHKDGHVVWGRMHVSLTRDAAGAPGYAIGQIQDITDRKHAEEMARASRERLQAIIGGMPAGAFVKDLEGRYEVVNQTLAAMVGRSTEEMVGQLDRNLFSAQTVARLEARQREALESDQPVTSEWSIDHERGSRTYLVQVFALRDASGAPYAIAGTGTDITERVRADEERRRLEARAQEAQRLETVGRLAGGIAHDFNNLLSVILNNASLAADALPEHARARADLEEIRAAAERAADLTHQLVVFSRQEMVEPQILDPSAVVLRAQRLLERTLGEDVELRTEIAGGVPAIEIDQGQLERVLLNLAVNARDAMPSGGELRLVTEAERTDAGTSVCIAVCDTGYGMSEDVAARAFEPFFTTKPTGEGTGLGLATVYGIVTQAGGEVEFASRPGEGTRVVVRFPAAESSPDAPQSHEELPDGGHGETLLVVEDEASVRRLAGRLLRQAGYGVIEAEDASEALDAVESSGQAIDLLLTDVVMPGISGRELAEQVGEARPEAAILFMSGYTDDVVVRHGVARDGLSFLQKPFTRDSLLRAVRDALSSRPSSVAASGASEGSR